jgi:hypothetical protein
MSDMNEEELPEQAVQKLVAWRQRNGLSQRAAVRPGQTGGKRVLNNSVPAFGLGL